MRGVEVKHVRRRDVDLEKVWDVESATGKGVLYVTKSKNESSKRAIPMNQAARGAIVRMLKRADALGHTDPRHYVWCASQPHQFDPTKPASKWDGAWRSLRKAAGLPGFRFHDLRHTVVTDLLEAGEPEHVIEAVTGHLSRRMLEHYSHQRLKAKGQMLTRMEQRRKRDPRNTAELPRSPRDRLAKSTHGPVMRGGAMIQSALTQKRLRSVRRDAPPLHKSFAIR